MFEISSFSPLEILAEVALHDKQICAKLARKKRIEILRKKKLARLNESNFYIDLTSYPK